MPSNVKQKAARSHEEALRTVCASCWKKSKNVRSVSDKVAGLICQFVYKDYDKSNGFHPTVVCTGCQATLSYLDKVNNSQSSRYLQYFPNQNTLYLQDPDETKRNLPKTPPYEELIAPGPGTRSSSISKCVCKICEIARMLYVDYRTHAKTYSSAPGHPLPIAYHCAPSVSP